MGQVAIVGGGVAGLATAWALAQRKVDVTLFEQEPHFGAQSSGRSAGIFRLAVAEPVNVALATRAREIGKSLVPGGVVRATGGLYPCDDDAVRAAILDASERAGVRRARSLDWPEGLLSVHRPAVYSPEDGVIDTHALIDSLRREALRHGATLKSSVTVDEIVSQAGRVSGVRCGGELFKADTVVDASGAWAPELRGAGLPSVLPRRRHLFVLDTPHARAFKGVVWDLTEGIYARPESGGLLVSACDETPMQAGHVPVDRAVAALLFDKLERWAPALGGASVRRVWAGLRPLTPDHRFVVGEDPLLQGLVRVGGFGGHGMTAGAAAGEMAAAIICGEEHRWAKELSPARFDARRG